MSNLRLLYLENIVSFFFGWVPQNIAVCLCLAGDRETKGVTNGFASFLTNTTQAKREINRTYSNRPLLQGFISAANGMRVFRPCRARGSGKRASPQVQSCKTLRTAGPHSDFLIRPRKVRPVRRRLHAALPLGTSSQL